MNPVLLTKELCAFLETVLTEFLLETGKGQDKAPQVAEGWLPPKGSSDKPDFPYVIVRLCEGTDSEERGQATIKIIVGTYSEEIEGWKDVGNIIMRIRNTLLITRILNNRYQLELPLKWQLFEEQPYPEWIGQITTKWTIALPIEQVKEDDYVYEE
ncbi:MAG: hypothetical protein ACOX0F_13855 [Syntrophomonadaceae bacterium]|jgi:hypothetical protein